MPNVILHKIDGSPPVRAVLMTAEVIGLEFDKREVPMGSRGLETRTPEYLKKNPTHTVPLIEDGSFILADSHAIITYLVSKYGADKRATLYPVDLNTRAIVDHRLFLDASLLFPRLRPIIASILLEKATKPTPQQTEDVNEAYGFLEKYLERSAYLAADHITLADISCVSTISSLEVLVPISEEKFPKLTEWFKKIQARDWYQKANVPGLTDLRQFLTGAIEKNASS